VTRLEVIAALVRLRADNDRALGQLLAALQADAGKRRPTDGELDEQPQHRRTRTPFPPR
jgi:hypothetical protein